jgi:hypothetical protein
VPLQNTAFQCISLFQSKELGRFVSHRKRALIPMAYKARVPDFVWTVTCIPTVPCLCLRHGQNSVPYLVHQLTKDKWNLVAFIDFVNPLWSAGLLTRPGFDSIRIPSSAFSTRYFMAGWYHKQFLLQSQFMVGWGGHKIKVGHPVDQLSTFGRYRLFVLPHLGVWLHSCQRSTYQIKEDY